jgi:hypothetical protein
VRLFIVYQDKNIKKINLSKKEVQKKRYAINSRLTKKSINLNKYNTFVIRRNKKTFQNQMYYFQAIVKNIGKNLNKN